MPNVVSSWDAVPDAIKRVLASLKANATFKPSLVAGPVLRFQQQIQTLFGPVDILTMWGQKTHDGQGNPLPEHEQWSPYSPQAMICIPPAQAVLSLVNIDTEPMFMLIDRTRDLAVAPEYVMPFWKQGLTPSLFALLDYVGIPTTEFPRGALADGVGFSVPQEAVEELGMEVSFFIHAGQGANPDPGQLAFSLPHMIAVMNTKTAVEIDEREAVTFRKFRLVKPENLLKELRTLDGVTLSQVVTFLQTIAYDLNVDTQAFSGTGSPLSLDTTTVSLLKTVAWNVLRGPIDHMSANWG
jgi:hypothetical protein